MSKRERAGMKAARAEECFLAIGLAIDAPRLIGIGTGYTDVAAVLETLRLIKRKAIEAEVLLRTGVAIEVQS